MKAQEIVERLRAKYNDRINEVREDKHICGIKKRQTLAYWLKVDKLSFKDIIRELCEMNYPFLSVISGRDAGSELELIYHFYVNYGGDLEEEGIYISIFVPKDNPKLPSISDLIPGAILSEKEKQEMLGVDIECIGKDRVFLPREHPKNNFPWRKK